MKKQTLSGNMYGPFGYRISSSGRSEYLVHLCTTQKHFSFEHNIYAVRKDEQQKAFIYTADH